MKIIKGMEFVYLKLKLLKFIEKTGSTGFDSKFPRQSKQVERWDKARKSYVSTFKWRK